MVSVEMKRLIPRSAENLILYLVNEARSGLAPRPEAKVGALVTSSLDIKPPSSLETGRTSTSPHFCVNTIKAKISILEQRCCCDGYYTPETKILVIIATDLTNQWTAGDRRHQCDDNIRDRRLKRAPRGTTRVRMVIELKIKTHRSIQPWPGSNPLVNKASLYEAYNPAGSGASTHRPISSVGCAGRRQHAAAAPINDRTLV
ncbi:hypothetical protein EVAR_25656_1 [Eumeta japonica]|uniref:Uncharacterized protein n=1 Tax=Eumeta variegata TaxID=151549 RepID=A0A4C1WEF0_EUMVA|nr:hypothetical protein EVAR_25656_1 [Eumeta japonica]